MLEKEPVLRVNGFADLANSYLYAFWVREKRCLFPVFPQRKIWSITSRSFTFFFHLQSTAGILRIF
ncbi:hypothetical protein OC25_02165 [Pedobacter kyungheensis]|uniref:Uncharacterized protein n=1 Tax=Pedobacter kyungheensis TaxID=1069985 RepID=A0A0C1G8Y9_9SPHI|nr:hypothetical protein OC25_02165 [Pedobacter kyungheensis]